MSIAASAPAHFSESHTGQAAEQKPELRNYFDSAAAAERYATDRPSGHARVLALLRATLADALPVNRALDVGCGTGQSSVALLPYAAEIVGIDASSEMLAQAQRHERIRYCKGYAEALPFRAEYFDLVTVSSAYHWFDHEQFLTGASRILRPGGWLVLYKASSLGRAADNTDFERWRREVLDVRYPKVARNDDPLTAERAGQFGFTEVMSERRTHRLRHTLEDYVANLLTHSRIIRVVDGGLEPISVTRAWLRSELAPFFHDGEIEFAHDDRITIARHEATV